MKLNQIPDRYIVSRRTHHHGHRIQHVIFVSHLCIYLLILCTDIFVLSHQGTNVFIFLSHNSADLLNSFDHLSHLLLFIQYMLFDRLKPASLSWDYLIGLLRHRLYEALEVWLGLILVFIGQTSQLINVHLLVVDCHFELLDHLWVHLVLIFMLFNSLL